MMSTITDSELFQTYSQLPDYAKREVADFVVNKSKQVTSKSRQEKLLELLLNAPVADEATIRRQDEVNRHLRQWKIREF